MIPSSCVFSCIQPCSSSWTHFKWRFRANVVIERKYLPSYKCLLQYHRHVMSCTFDWVFSCPACGSRFCKMHVFFVVVEGRRELYINTKSQYLYSTHIYCHHLKSMYLTLKMMILKKRCGSRLFHWITTL